MLEIKLPTGSWRYDDQDSLGPPGGFGAVFRGQGARGELVAIKRLQSAFQNREMRIADFLLGHSLAHVIPILDAGFDASARTNFIVMPIATTSLQQRIASAPVNEIDALEILTAIASGLDEIGDIIHRDLKPGNVLLHDEVWKLADLGLARFAEAATSQNTMRDALTPPYAAPEQWRGERPAKATDVYAFGCIMYALLQGAPPFGGPESSDFSHQHQFVAPPGLKASSHLKRLAASCLAKAPELRPSIGSLRKQLDTARLAANQGGVQQLASAAAAIVERESIKEEERLQIQREKKRREILAAQAIQVLDELHQDLETMILRDAPNAQSEPNRYDSKIKKLILGDAKLEFGVLFPFIESNSIPPQTGKCAGSGAWDILAGGYISAETGGLPSFGRSANLWFGRLLDSDDYRWWEVSYLYPDHWRNDNSVSLIKPEPFHIESLNSLGTIFLVAEDPLPITTEFVDEFLQRWIGRIAQLAGVGWLEHTRLPKKSFERRKVSEKFKLDKP